MLYEQSLSTTDVFFARSAEWKKVFLVYESSQEAKSNKMKRLKKA